MQVLIKIMAKKTNNYKYFRMLTVCLTTLMLPFGTFVGFQFGAGRLKAGLIALGIQTGLTLLQAHIWWLTFEKAGDR